MPLLAVPPLASGERRQAPLEVFLESEGYHTVAVSVRTGDSFPPDDRRFAVLEAVESLPVLVVEGDPGVSPAEGSAYYLKAALQPTGRLRGGIRVEVRRPGAPGALDDYAAVFICNLASPAAWAGSGAAASSFSTASIVPHAGHGLTVSVSR